MSESPQAEPALSRRLSRIAVAPTAAAVPMTRAELRRRAREEAELAVASGVPVEILPELTPEALAVTAAPAESPVEAAAEALGLAAPAPSLDEAEAPVRPTRRARRAPVAEPEGTALSTDAIELLELDGESPEPLVPLEPSATVVDGADVAPEAPGDPQRDAFDEAAKLFSFTGETPAQVAVTALAEQDAAFRAVEEEPRRRRGPSFRRVATTSFSIGVVGAVGLLTVGMTTPLEAVAAAQGTTAAATVSILAPAGDVAPDGDDIQAYVAPADVQNAQVVRSDDFETATLADLAAESGISNFSNFFVNNPKSPIQWPFAVGVPISYGFGMRSGTMHEGMDFTPGEGSPIQAIADGTVRIATESGGAFGVTVLIDHVIDGELVSSRYAHMEYGSLQVVPGQTVTVGTFLGRTGNTGRSFGAHTHFEILAGGTTPIDPEPWLREHAGG